jgi:hypothetical protein
MENSDALSQDKVNTTDPQNESDSEPPHPRGNVPFIANIPPPPNHEKERHTCRPDQTPPWKTILEVLAFSVGASVALIYWFQLYAMMGQLDQMSEQLPEIRKSAEAARSAAVTADAEFKIPLGPG